MENINKTNRRKFLLNAGVTITGTMLVSPILSLTKGCGRVQEELQRLTDVRYIKVAGEEGRFLGWPANNGVWTWNNGLEILVGYTDGDWVEQEGHNIGELRLTKLARSLDGGKSWLGEDPQNFVGSDGVPQPSTGDIHFDHPGFAMKVAAMGYHGTDDPMGRFFISYDRGKTWLGSYRFNEMNDDPNLEGMEITARTSYLVTGPDSCQIFMSARNPKLEFANRLDKPFVAETIDGGKTFKFISWIVPWTDQYRAVMPSTVKTGDGKIIVAVRRRNPRNIEQPCWIDTYVSDNNARTWLFLSKVGVTGAHNGNPPGLAILNDGRLACTYGNRSIRKIVVRFSDDDGITWGEELVIRENPLNHDIGYPQLVQNSDGDMVALYYIATDHHPHSYIEASIWNP